MSNARLHRTADLLAAGAAAGLLAACGARTITAIAPGAGGWLLAPAAALGVAAADLASGLLHWACDSFGSERTPVLGRTLIRPFREHHRDPEAILRQGTLKLSRNSCLAALPVLSVTLAAPGPSPGASAALFIHATLLVFVAASLATNLFHRWAHAARVPPAVGWLQSVGLILSREAHHPHHAGGRRAYCVTTGWMNGWLDRARVLPRAAAWLRATWRRSPHAR
ncbi:MAG: fatty acid desaturase family protein [Planctomycetales bacterium]|nr:fatty acid desaturase family protein [Planctomycetales bacterium]